MWLAVILVGLYFLGAGYLVYRWVWQMVLFKCGHNPYARICKRCGAHQNMYQSNIEDDNSTWWEDVYPIGNNEKCKCHSFTDYHS